ncbi:MAG: tetratricopeptide repeat protein [Synechococcaceae cyanobacterium SM2_3_1]|nr:tetratricopeptide repeat protein [Synechococcaceae cyanobacterium SM2_3_1]
MRTLYAALVMIGISTIPVATVAAPSKPKEAPAEPAEAQLPAEVKLYNEGVTLLRRLRFAEAQDKFAAALEINDEFAEAHNNLGYVLRKQDPENFEQALEHYNRAISLKPDLAEAYMYRGALHVQMDNLEQAEADLAQLEEMESDLAPELAYVIENGEEKAPPSFYGVSEAVED